MNKTVEEAVKELPTTKCRTCDGAGFTSEHSIYGHRGDGECTECPVQVQCDDCHTYGVYTTLDEVQKLLTSQRNSLIEKIKLLQLDPLAYTTRNGKIYGQGVKRENTAQSYNQALTDVLAIITNSK